MRGLLIDTATETGFDPKRPYGLNPRVGLRPEPFGALAYHFDSRRLVFLKSRELVDVVEALDGQPSVLAALEAMVPAARHGSFTKALTSLAEAEVIRER